MAQFYPKFYTLIPGGLLVGFGGGPLWCAKCTYLTIISETYEKVSDVAANVIVIKFYGVFFMLFQLSQVWGNLISAKSEYYNFFFFFLQIHRLPRKKNVVFFIFFILSMVFFSSRSHFIIQEIKFVNFLFTMSLLKIKNNKTYLFDVKVDTFCAVVFVFVFFLQLI